MRAIYRKAGAAMTSDGDGVDVKHPNGTSHLREIIGGKGRPKTGEEHYDRAELDRLLVDGLRIVDPKTGVARMVRLSHRTIAQRLGISRGTVAAHAKKRNCTERREQAKLLEQRETDAAIATHVATQSAVSMVDILTTIDTLWRHTAADVDKGKLRAQNMVDVNTLARLKSFLQGGADSRMEIQGSITLEAMQRTHRDVVTTSAVWTPEMAGESGAALPAKEEDPKNGPTEDTE